MPPEEIEIEIEVFRLITFDKDKRYEFALKTRTTGTWPNEKYYTINPLQYLGKHVSSETWGYGDGRGGVENFEDADGTKTRIVYDYDGRTCFREVVEIRMNIT